MAVPPPPPFPRAPMALPTAASARRASRALTVAGLPKPGASRHASRACFLRPHGGTRTVGSEDGHVNSVTKKTMAACDSTVVLTVTSTAARACTGRRRNVPAFMKVSPRSVSQSAGKSRGTCATRAASAPVAQPSARRAPGESIQSARTQSLSQSAGKRRSAGAT